MDDKKKKEVKKPEAPKVNPEIEILKAQVNEFKNKYLRALADYQNLEKRILLDREMVVKSANNSLILKILPFLDNLEKAEIFVKDQGLKLTKDQLEKFLSELGLVELDIINKEYDPYTAEVIEMVPGEKDNMVVEVLKKGYKLNDKILRVAQVKVSKKTS